MGAEEVGILEHHKSGPSSPAMKFAWVACHERCQEVVPVVEAASTQLGVAVAALQDGAAGVEETSYEPVEQVGT